MFRARLGGERTCHACASADVEHELVLEQVRVVHDRVTVRARAHGVLQCLLMDAARAMSEHSKDLRTRGGRALLTKVRVRVRVAAHPTRSAVGICERIDD